jgi:hypothetical protein
MTKKATNKKPSKSVEVTQRKRKVPAYKSFKLTKKIPHPKGPIASSRVILFGSFKLIRSNIKVLAGIILVYAIINVTLVRGFASPLNIAELKNTLKETFGTTPDGLTLVGTVFSALLGTSNAASSDTAAVYQNILFILISLALIWVFRQSSAGKKPTIKEAFYNAFYPLVQFLLVLVVMVLQLLPAYFGVFIYGIVSSGGLAVSGLEQAIWIIFLGLLILLSMYMICSSLFAFYIVTLPNMTPMQALRSSRALVFSRRLSVFRKLVILPLVAFIILVLIVVPAIYFIPVVAPWLYFVLTLASIVFLHAFLFTLYKELL